MLMQNLTNLVVPSQLSQSLVLSRTKDHSSPQGLLGFVSFCPTTPSILFYCLGQRTKQLRSQVLSPTRLSLSLSLSLSLRRER